MVRKIYSISIRVVLILFGCILTLITYTQETFESPLSLSITFDQWPEESSWDIRLGDTTVLYYHDYSGLGDESDEITILIDSLYLVPALGYTFNFYDSFIDGICCIQGSGSYSLTDHNGTLIVQGGDFEVKQTTTFNVLGDLCTNGVQDLHEDGVDCGNSCVPCIAGCTLSTAHNYNSNANVNNNSCETCDDGVQNGDEEGVDCGGGLCEPCSQCQMETYVSSSDIFQNSEIQVSFDASLRHEIRDSTSLTISAGNSIEFNSGFQISIGSSLLATIGSCDSN